MDAEMQGKELEQLTVAANLGIEGDRLPIIMIIGIGCEAWRIINLHKYSVLKDCHFMMFACRYTAQE
jgi:hypothetical protein